MKFNVLVDEEIKEVGALIWLDNGTTLRVFPRGEEKSYVAIKGEGEETAVNCEIIPLHSIDNTEYKNKELKKQLYFQQNINADIVKENFDLSNEVYAQKRFINSIESQIQISENAMQYWEEQYNYVKKGFWFLFAMYLATSLLLIFN